MTERGRGASNDSQTADDDDLESAASRRESKKERERWDRELPEGEVCPSEGTVHPPLLSTGDKDQAV